ncbi:MAG: 4a-hydroxytetrahydrobiopterin dehydratase [Sideroxydans sp.]|jgi:4a-hydroxytetrahydrobiopterin dehydratase
MSDICDLSNRKCKPCEGGMPPLPQDEIDKLLKQLNGWVQHDMAIGKLFEFKNYYQTMAFVNSVAWLSHQENHHPDLSVGYNRCYVNYSTHAVNGLSENDFICAAKVDRLFHL